MLLFLSAKTPSSSMGRPKSTSGMKTLEMLVPKFRILSWNFSVILKLDTNEQGWTFPSLSFETVVP